MNILLGVTGSVAAIKIPEVYKALRDLGTVKVVVTECAHKIMSTQNKHFQNSYEPIRSLCMIYDDEKEWNWRSIGDPVLHIDLKDWADVLVIAPLTANTLAKMANGICDNLLTCIYRAYPMTPEFKKPLVLAPAMNTDMWYHPVTEKHLEELRQRHTEWYGRPLNTVSYIKIVPPIEKKLACGTTGIGAMAEPADIAKAVENVTT